MSVIPSSNDLFNSRDQLNLDTYDSNGNTLTSTQLSTQIFLPDTYDFEDRLIVRHKPDGSTINLSYDADGIRRQKTLLDGQPHRTRIPTRRPGSVLDHNEHGHSRTAKGVRRAMPIR